MVELEKEIDKVHNMGYFVDDYDIKVDNNITITIGWSDEETKGTYIELSNRRIIKGSPFTSELLKQVRTLQKDIKKYGVDKAVEKHTGQEEWSQEWVD